MSKYNLEYSIKIKYPECSTCDHWKEQNKNTPDMFYLCKQPRFDGMLNNIASRDKFFNFGCICHSKLELITS